MKAATKALLALELQNLWGKNVLRHTKDPRVRRKAALMAVAWILVIAMVTLYAGGLTWGLVQLGAADVAPAYLIAIASLVLFFFGIFKAGSTIFRQDGYDLLCSLPVTQSAIVLSRLLRMYVENLAVALVVIFPGLAVYSWFLRPGCTFWFCGISAILAVPLLPMAAASLLGALVIAISSRMKHKSLAEAALSLLLVIGVFLFLPNLVQLEDTMTPDMLLELADTVSSLLGKLYPPAIYLGSAMVRSSLADCLLWVGMFIALFAAVTALISVRFHRICRRLFSRQASHNYRMTSQREQAVLISLCRREFQRYFASGIYVSNTIIGPVLGAALSGVLLVTGSETITTVLPLSVDFNRLIPLLVAGIFCIMTTTGTSISMEGKQWWIVRSLPLSSKTILDAKILMNLLLFLPFFLISEVLLTLALKPEPLALLWQVLLPALLILFSCVYGITINLHFPVLDWDSEVAVVKQSASALLSMGGFLLALLCTVLTALAPSHWVNLLNLVLGVLLLAATALLYRHSCRFDLHKI